MCVCVCVCLCVCVCVCLSFFGKSNQYRLEVSYLMDVVLFVTNTLLALTATKLANVNKYI